MDTITHALVGSAIGYSIYGKKENRLPVVWGAIGGIIPDLDITILPFVDEIEKLQIHRGF
ncbi:MAG: metal-dependent hydrolase, partial [Ignavibacteriales bacterium]|nr:metal-dependent hydrolase [Ignavibacteriales bacterium]